MLNSTLTKSNPQKKSRRFKKTRSRDSNTSAFNNVIISQEIQPYQLKSHKTKFNNKGTIEHYLNFLKSLVSKRRSKSVETAIKTRNQIIFNNCKNFQPVYDKNIIDDNANDTETLSPTTNNSNLDLPKITFTTKSNIFNDLDHKFNKLSKKIEEGTLVSHINSEAQSVSLYDAKSPLAFFYDNLTFRQNNSNSKQGLSKNELGVLSFDTLDDNQIIDNDDNIPNKQTLSNLLKANQEQLLDDDFIAPIPLNDLVDDLFDTLGTDDSFVVQSSKVNQDSNEDILEEANNELEELQQTITLTRDQNNNFHMSNQNNTNPNESTTINNISEQIIVTPKDLNQIRTLIKTDKRFRTGVIIENDEKFIDLKDNYFAKDFPHLQLEKLALADFIELLKIIGCTQKIELGYIVYANNKTSKFLRCKVGLINSGAAFIESEDDSGKFTNKKSKDNFYVSEKYVEFYNLQDNEVLFCVINEERVQGNTEVYSRYSFIFYRYEPLEQKIVTEVLLDTKDNASVCYVKQGKYDIPQYLKVPAEFNDLSGSMLAVVTTNIKCKANFKTINNVDLFREPERALSFDSEYVLTQVFNSDSEFENQIDSILVKFGLQSKFPDEVKKAVKSFADTVGSYDTTVRKDLTHLDFVTIDGEDARDFDDAVYVERNATGFKLFVAIADVSYYVRDLDTIDLEARERTTSIYFPTRVIPMLPEELSNGLCSLNPNVERFTLVCEMQISKTGELVAHTFYEACIISKKRFTYNIVQNIIDNNFELEAEYTNEKLNNLVKDLYSCFKILERNKGNRGAINIDTSEPKFTFNEKGEVIDIYFESRNEAHKLIEEMMVVANQAAAKFVYNHNVPAPHRNHAMPDPERVERLNCLLAAYNLSLPTYPTSADYRLISEQIAKLANKDTIFANVLRSLPRALYEADSSGHFGLALEKYAQFTSPIRRYPDLLLHRAIKTAIYSNSEIAKGEGAYAYSVEKMEGLCEKCSENEFNVDRAYFDFTDWVKCSFMMQFLGKTFIGIISTVTNNGCFVTIPEYQIDGFCSNSSSGYSKSSAFVPGSKVKVILSDVGLQKRQITFTLANEATTQGGYTLNQANKPKGKGSKNKKSTFNKSKAKSKKPVASDKTKSSKPKSKTNNKAKSSKK